MSKNPGKRCGIIMPISSIDGYAASHWTEVLLIIKEALQDTSFAVELVSNSDEVGVIQKRIVQNIYENELVICDVSAKNPNVMFELGMRLAFDKPALIIKDDQTNYIFDTGPIEHIEYPRNLNYHAVQEFKLKLRNKAIATYEASLNSSYTTFLSHFGKFIVAKIDEEPVGKDAFLMHAINELQHDISTIKRNLSSKTENDAEHPKLRYPSPRSAMQKFVDEDLSRLTHKLDWIKLKDVNSPEFTEILDRYFSKYYPDLLPTPEFKKNAIEQLAYVLDSLRAFH